MIGHTIKTARQARGLTLQVVGNVLGIDGRHVQAWEAGRRNPGPKHLAKLAEVLGLQVTDLLKGGMREHPLLMQGPLVRATLAGLKTQTRRPLRNQPPSGYHLVRVCGPWAEFENDGPTLAKYSTKSSFGEAGDRLWVRETWGIGARPCPVEGGREGIEYQADEGFQEDDISLLPLYSVDPPEGHTLDEYCKRGWRPSIHMPRWACRLVLPLVSVRVERVQDITEEDAIAEGVPHNSDRPIDKMWCAACLGHGVVERFALGTMSTDDCSECDTAKKLFRNIWVHLYGQESWDANPWVWVAEWDHVEVSK